ncbi:MAG TPA: hypothetical protein VLB44_22350 [Kofleriaceae bacterium]|nr:hypothetical protein [Kofleriaceae bacterium]
MPDPDLTLAILREIRSKLDETNQRIDDTNKRIDESNARLDYLSNQIFYMSQYLRHRVERALVGFGKRMANVEAKVS